MLWAKRQEKLIAFLKGVATFLSIFYAVLSIISHNPHIHKWIHYNADSSDHICAITLLNHGSVEACNNDVLIATDFILGERTQSVNEFFKILNPNLHPSKRAPPAIV
ncbi:MAG: hypothetical protein ACPMAG_08900 [Limisphaerales bacterium]